MTFLVFPSQSYSEQQPTPSEEALAGLPNQLSAQEVPYELLLGIHLATILPEPAAPPTFALPENPAIAAQQPFSSAPLPEPRRDASLSAVARRRRSALDFDAQTPPMERSDLEQLLDFATRDWLADWRGNFPASTVQLCGGADLVTLYLYVHRVRDCEPGVYRWDRTTRSLEQLHRGNVERVAAFLSLEQTLAGNSCFTVSMIADLARAGRVFGNRGYRYIYFEAGAIGQRFYLGAEALNWNATGIGAFYDDDVHRYLGFLAETDNSVAVSVNTAEQAALVMLGSPASRHAAAPIQEVPVPTPTSEATLPSDSRRLPQQVIYHFSVGRAISDPRIEA